MRNDRLLCVADSADYEIRLAGVFDICWGPIVCGLSIVIEEIEDAGVTLLTGRVADQAALLGVLNLAFSLGLSVLSVKCLSPSVCPPVHDLGK